MSPRAATSNVSPLKHHKDVMNSTGQSFWRQSISIDHSAAATPNPARISAHKKITSACIPGGLSLNSPQTDPTENAFSREHSRLAGFGPVVANAMIGNAGRRGNSLTVSDCKDHRKALGTIGWGVTNVNLDQGVWRRLLPEMPHKKAYDFGGLKDLPHMDTTCKFALHLDNQLGLPYDMLDDLSVREQRIIVKRRLAE